MSGINIKQHVARRNSGQNHQKGGFSLKGILEKEISLFPYRFSDKNKESFYLELGTLLSAGLDIRSALELIEGEQEKLRHATLIGDVKNRLINGSSLWEALRDTGHFTPYEYFSVQIGEETGKLTLVLDQLYNFFSLKLKQRRQIMSALSYPIIIMVTSVGAVAFMLLFIVPMFSDVFKRFGGELPQLTRLIIDFAGVVRSNFFLLLMATIFVVAFIRVNRNKQWMRKASSKAIRRIPVIGKVIYSIHLARFCSSMSLLLGSKVPVIRSLKLVNQMIVFYPIQATLGNIERDVYNGLSLHASMASFEIYDKKMVSLIKVGEEVNKLDVFFSKLSSQYTASAEHQTSLLNTFLEPMMIIFLGVIVGFVLLAMYLPMFELSTNIGR